MGLLFVHQVLKRPTLRPKDSPVGEDGWVLDHEPTVLGLEVAVKVLGVERRTDDNDLAAGYEHIHNYGMEIGGRLISLEAGIDDVVLQAVIDDNPVGVSTTHRRPKTLTRQTRAVTAHDIGSRPVVGRGLG